MQWPVRNPDLNPIEHIWDQMFIRAMDNLPTKMARLRGALLQAWGAVTPERMEVHASTTEGRDGCQGR